MELSTGGNFSSARSWRPSVRHVATESISLRKRWDSLAAPQLRAEVVRLEALVAELEEKNRSLGFAADGAEMYWEMQRARECQLDELQRIARSAGITLDVPNIAMTEEGQIGFVRSPRYRVHPILAAAFQTHAGQE